MKAHPGCKPAAWGAVAGAIAIMILGFSWFGWMRGDTAEKMANQRAEAAVVVALTPICVEKFQHQAGAVEKLAEFKKISSSWGSPIADREGWLGHHARERGVEFGGGRRVRRKARQPNLTCTWTSR